MTNKFRQLYNSFECKLWEKFNGANRLVIIKFLHKLRLVLPNNEPNSLDITTLPIKEWGII